MPEPSNSDVFFDTYHMSLPTVQPTKIFAMLPLGEHLEDVNVSLIILPTNPVVLTNGWVQERYRKLKTDMETKMESQRAELLAEMDKQRIQLRSDMESLHVQHEDRIVELGQIPHAW